MNSNNNLVIMRIALIIALVLALLVAITAFSSDAEADDSLKIKPTACITNIQGYWIAEYSEDVKVKGGTDRVVHMSVKVGDTLMVRTMDGALTDVSGFSKDDVQFSNAGGFYYPPISPVPQYEANLTRGQVNLEHYYELGVYAVTASGIVEIDPYQYSQCVKSVQEVSTQLALHNDDDSDRFTKSRSL